MEKSSRTLCIRCGLQRMKETRALLCNDCRYSLSYEERMIWDDPAERKKAA